MISQETFQELLAYIQSIAPNHRELYAKEDPTETEILLGSLCALQEEVGELTQEMRRLTKMLFNREKALLGDRHKVLMEASDVLICTLMLMRLIQEEGTIDHVITEKIGKNKSRGY